MHLPKKVADGLALKNTIENLTEEVTINDSIVNGERKISIKVGSRTFVEKGPNALEKLESRIRRHKPPTVKMNLGKRFGRIGTVVKNAFRKRA